MVGRGMATTEPGSAPEVRLTGGPARGTWESGVQLFRGIPYAAPPVGVNRFAAPQPARAWEGVRPATAFGPPPPQPDALGRGRAELDAGDEWLTVNVWTPAADPAAALPVMVWIQGGAYVVGDAGAPEFDGARLAGNGGV